MRKSKTLGLLYLVLDRSVIDYSRMLKILPVAINAGVGIVQLRDKFGLAKDIVSFSRKAKRIIRGRIPYIINDRADLVLATDADGVHVGQDDLSVPAARKILGAKRLVGLSCQTYEQACEAKRWGVDYIGFGSVFKTQTKPDRKPMDLRLLKKVQERIEIPVYAIGGIDSKNFSLLLSIGIERVAVTRAICHANNVRAITKNFVKALTNNA